MGGRSWELVLVESCLFAKNCHRVFPLPSRPQWGSRKETQPRWCSGELEGPLCPCLSPGFPQLVEVSPRLRTLGFAGVAWGPSTSLACGPQ